MRWLRGGLAAALLMAACGCAVTGWGERPQAAETTTTAAPSPEETEDAQATKDATDAKKPTDARDLYLESLRRQALQPTITTVQEYYRQEKFYPGGSRMVVVAGFDYRTKDVRLEKSQVIVTGRKTRTSYAVWCLNGSEEWLWSLGDWTKRSGQCPSLPSQAWLNDGLGVGGLTEEQAGIFVGKLDEWKGLIRARGMRLVNRGGKRYVRLEVRVEPLAFGGGSPVGAGLFHDAFKHTGLDSLAHPYGLLASGRSGMDIVRYIDPVTRLPVYSEVLETGHGEWKMHRVEYAFGRPVGRSTLPTKPGIARLKWQPEGK
ncbi:hypothetical protein ACFXJ8_39665 [Nonomuraea sp. NPDC059194]|uniref:hypothetical protein n=1 Tax=Nonomuraea sp. NPDC059194 TaxID=3346764 RepID=UPI00367F981B